MPLSDEEYWKTLVMFKQYYHISVTILFTKGRFLNVMLTFAIEINVIFRKNLSNMMLCFI